MAEQFELKGVENNPAQQAGSVNEALFSDANGTSKCAGGGPGVKCGAAPDLPNTEPTVISASRPSDLPPIVRGPQNNYPVVFFDPSSLPTDDRYRAHKDAEKQRFAKKEKS